VYITASNKNRAQKTIEERKDETEKQSFFFPKPDSDLVDLPSVKAALEEFTRE
jgi:hypothetical protein